MKENERKWKKMIEMPGKMRENRTENDIKDDQAKMTPENES